MTISAIILRVLNFLLMIGIPALLALFLYRRGKAGFRPIWIGVVAFVLSQVGHIPFNQYLMLPLLERAGISLVSQGGSQLVILGLAAGLSAGIFEEITRYLVLRFWLKKDQQELLPIKYGVGHGGIEAILSGLLALLAFVQVMALGGEGSLVAFDPEQTALIQSQLSAYWAVPWQYSLLGALERVSALAFHIGASIMVYKSVVERKPIWLLIAILGHTALDAFVVIYAPSMDIVLLEGILFVFAFAWLGTSWFVRARDPDKDEPIQGDHPEVRFQTPKVTSDQIEASRYDE
jgi:uncharacterized membrane protein YhfC